MDLFKYPKKISFSHKIRVLLDLFKNYFDWYLTIIKKFHKLKKLKKIKNLKKFEKLF